MEINYGRWYKKGDKTVMTSKHVREIPIMAKKDILQCLFLL